MNKIFSWVEIPTQDIERAAKFYGDLFDVKLTIADMGPRRMATIWFEPGQVGGSLLQAPDVQPGAPGMHLYLNAGRGNGLEKMIARVQSLGGTILLPATPMGEDGRFATFRDTEGNVLSLFAEN